MEIGKFKTTSPDSLTGILLGFPHEIVFELQANGGQPLTAGKRRPHYKAFVRQAGVELQVGAAWEEESKKKPGQVYYSVEFDNLGPAFPRKLHGNLVPSTKDAGVCSFLSDTPEEKAAYAARKALNGETMAQAVA